MALKNLRNVTVKLLHPSAVMPVKLNGQVVPESINSLMTVFIQLYVLIFLAGMMIILLSGIQAIEAAAASVTALSNVGPGLGASGNTGNYSHFNGVARMTMAVLMIIGRLEIFTIFALFTRPFWKK